VGGSQRGNKISFIWKGPSHSGGWSMLKKKKRENPVKMTKGTHNLSDDNRVATVHY